MKYRPIKKLKAIQGPRKSKNILHSIYIFAFNMHIAFNLELRLFLPVLYFS